MALSAGERAYRGGGSRGAVFDPELDEDLLQVLVHRARTDVQDLADVAIGLAATDPQQHFRLARRQSERALQDRLLAVGIGGLGEAKQQLVGPQRAQERTF